MDPNETRNTLDTICPNETDRENMSYLYGRDPSIITYGQRPLPAQDTRKNLFSQYEAEDLTSIEEDSSTASSKSQSKQTVKVFLRIKPFPRNLKLSQEEQRAYQIINPMTLLTRVPVTDNNTSCMKRVKDKNSIIYRKFSFTQTFGQETTQLVLFDQAVKQQLNEFLAGQDCTIMTYGTTNSGKSYTLQGTATSPGIIPRAIEFIFSNITAKPLPSYKPVHHCDVVCLNNIERAQEIEAKTKVISFSTMDKMHYANTYEQMQKLLSAESPVRPSQCTNTHYSVWVSFAEIYNETIYDLLSNDYQKKRPVLKLGADSQGRSFIRDLKTICVNSGAEAYQILMAGQYNLKIAATALNARSSRSHCIFAIKLLKYCKDNAPESVEVSTFTFCDLAGSERLKKTLNIGDRLKEAQNINTSLLVLGRCLKAIYTGQLTNQKIDLAGPFRESKLTRLFQKPLSGKEQLTLIVNINPVPQLYIETQNVLNFSAIAKQIVIEQKQKASGRTKSRFSSIVSLNPKCQTNWDSIELESFENADMESAEHTSDDDYAELIEENKKLKQEIMSLKSSFVTREYQIRQEMANTYSAKIKELEADWKNLIRNVEQQQEDAREWSVKQVEDFYKQKLISSKKRKRFRSTDSDEMEDDEKDLDQENSILKAQIASFKSLIKDLRRENKTMRQNETATTMELALLKEDLSAAKNLLEALQKDVHSDDESGKETKFYVKALETQLDERKEQVKKLKQFLNEAKEDYIAITTDARHKETQLKEQQEALIESEERIEDLEAQLDYINICLTEKDKTVETLEEKLESKCKMLNDAEERIQRMRDEITDLENANTILKDQFAVHSDDKKVGECERSSEDEEYEEFIVKEEIVSETSATTTENVVEEEETEDVAEKLLIVQTENSKLNKRIAQNMIDIEDLKTALESAKNKLHLLSSTIHSFSTTDEKENRTSGPKNEKVEKGCQVELQEKEETITKEQINQTSFSYNTADAYVQTDFDSKNSGEIEEQLIETKTKCSCIVDKQEQTYLIEINADLIKELRENIEKLSRSIESCEQEKSELQEQILENTRKLQNLEEREREKDEEINRLQKEIKRVIQESDGESDKIMQQELKKTIQALSRKEEELKQLQRSVESLQESYKDALLQITKVENVNSELEKNLLVKEREMEVFKKNREETIARYEALLKTRDMDLQKEKREVMRFQELFCGPATPLAIKDEKKKLQDRVVELENQLKKQEESPQKPLTLLDVTSSESAVKKEKRLRPRRKKEEKVSPIRSNAPVIDLSSTESKGSSKRRVAPVSNSEQSTDKKKTGRKKKLFVEESFTDLGPPQDVIPESTATRRRNLRKKPA